MATQTVQPLLNDAIEKLKQLIPEFDQGNRTHNENLFGALHALPRPALPESLTVLSVTYEEIEPETVHEAVEAEILKLDAIIDVVRKAGREEQIQSLAEVVKEIKEELEPPRHNNP